MRIQTVVQHDPSRAELLPPLLAALPDAQVVSDPEPESPLRSPWRTYQACLRVLEPEATHLLVIQDDAEPCRDLAEALPLVLASRPDDVLALFVPGVGEMRRLVLDGCYRGKRWVELSPREWVPLVAVVWPRAKAERFLDWAETRRISAGRTADDGIAGEFVRETHTRVLACVPSLVEHPDMVRSLVGTAHWNGMSPSRVAACWTGRDISALDLSW